MASVKAAADGKESSAVTINVAEPPPPEPVVSTVTVTPGFNDDDDWRHLPVHGGCHDGRQHGGRGRGIRLDEQRYGSRPRWMIPGLVTAVGAGTAMITATGNDVTSMPATVTVEEMAPEVDTVEIVDAMPVMLVTGETHQLMAVARTSDGTMVAGVTFAWSSDDIEVATVDSTVLVTAVGAGMAEITAMADDTTSDPMTVTVADPPPVSRSSNRGAHDRDDRGGRDATVHRDRL